MSEATAPEDVRRSAPLAQLRLVDEVAWHAIMRATDTSDRKQAETAQIIAATVLGDIPLALEISRTGFYLRAMHSWPDLVSNAKAKEDA